MMIAARESFAAARRRLPYDAEVEYLESTNTQWIDTGLVWKLGDTFRIETAQSQIRDQASFGVAARIYGFSNNDNNANPRGFFWGSAPYSGGRADVLPFVYGLAKHSITLNETSCVVDGVALSGSVTSGTADSLHTIPLFCRVNNSAITTINKTYNGKIYSWKHFRDGVLIRNMTPVRYTNEQGVSEGAMYDRANPTVGMNPDGSPRADGLYRNRGTGAFIFGPDKQEASW